MIDPSRPDVHAIEEAHAEQGDGQVVALHDDCIDVMNGDVANAHGVELETISERIAVGRLHRRLLAGVVVEPEAARLAGEKRDERRAGSYGKSNQWVGTRPLRGMGRSCLDGNEASNGLRLWKPRWIICPSRHKTSIASK
jgi:hypothetical protein